MGSSFATALTGDVRFQGSAPAAVRGAETAPAGLISAVAVHGADPPPIEPHGSHILRVCDLLNRFTQENDMDKVKEIVQHFG